MYNVSWNFICLRFKRISTIKYS